LANCNAIDIARAGVNIGIPIIAKIADLAAPDLSLDKSLHIESLTTPTLCGLALSIDYPSWDMRYPDEIAEAQRRGYTASKCFNLNGFAQEKAERYRIKAAARASEEQDRIAAAQGVADVQEWVAAAQRAAKERGIREEKARLAEARAAAERKESDSEITAVSTGSAFAITSSGHLLTNHHVVEDCELVVVHLFGKIFEETTVIASDKANDLSVLKADYTPGDSFKNSTRNAGLLEDIVLAGFPLSEQLSSSVKVTKGVVSSLAGMKNDYS
jgi:S1-C subfamily serine protease